MYIGVSTKIHVRDFCFLYIARQVHNDPHSVLRWSRVIVVSKFLSFCYCNIIQLHQVYYTAL